MFRYSYSLATQFVRNKTERSEFSLVDRVRFVYMIYSCLLRVFRLIAIILYSLKDFIYLDTLKHHQMHWW